MKKSKEYRNYKELKSKVAPKRFTVKPVNRLDSEFLIFTPHGGGIEPGTSEIVEEVAKEDFSHYSFEGHGNGCASLHITSHNFDEPKLIGQLKKHATAISIHGMANRQDCDIYIGGLDVELIEKVNKILSTAGYSVLTRKMKSIPGLEATDPNNVTNRCKLKQGVQIEISDSLRKSFFKGDYKKKRGRASKSDAFYIFCGAIRKTLLS